MARVLQYDPLAFLLYCRDKGACHQVTVKLISQLQPRGSSEYFIAKIVLPMIPIKFLATFIRWLHSQTHFENYY